MDSRHFDALTRALSAGNARRRLLVLLVTLPLVGGLSGFLGPEDTEAKGRRKRRKKRHKHGNGRRREKSKRKKKCQAASVAQTCAGRCGSVTNNCQQAVDCGSCACTTACGECLVCDGQTGECVVDSAQQGDACGDPGQVCGADGVCACAASSCPDCTTCGPNGQCVACDACCDTSGVCQDGTANAACGKSGETCDICTGQDQCQSRVCTCVPDCAGKCGGANDGCGGTCNDSCAAGQICDNQMCEACDVCAACTHTTVQPAIDAANAGGTVRICAGTYTAAGDVPVATITKSLTLVGAGIDATVLDGADTVRVLTNTAAATTVRNLTMTRGWPEVGTPNFGGGIFNEGTLTLRDMAVTHSGAHTGGGIGNIGTLTLASGALVTLNGAKYGGGIDSDAGSVTVESGGSVTANEAEQDGGGIRWPGGALTLDPGSDVSLNTAGVGNNCNPSMGACT